MVLTLQFSDSNGKQKFELKLAPDTTFEQLVKLVGEKTAAKGSVSLKNGDSLLVAANNDKLSKLSITNGAKLQFEIIPEVAPAAPGKEAPAPKKVPSDDWNETDYADSKNEDWGKFVADSVDDVFEVIEEDPLPPSQGGSASDVTIIAPPPSLVRQRSYKVMGKIQITQKQKDMVDDVTTVLNLGPGKSTVLLRHYKWNQEKLLKEYTTNPIKVMESAGIERGPDDFEPEVLDEDKDQKKDGSKEKEFDCPFCGSSVAFGNTYSMECGHRFCLDCWKNWFTAEFEKGAECIFTKCPEYKCKELVPTEIFQKYISKEQREKVEDWLNTSFVRLNNYIKWCPRQGCDKAVEYSKQGMKTVTCDCGYKFCFGCGNDAHDPAPCKAVLEWLKKDNSLLLWMREQQKVKDLVKACTNCHELIEKNQGCKHMTCRNCKHEFCWLCYQNWHGHNESLCNDYEGKDRQQQDKEAKGDSSAAGLRRYQFFYTRFENHQKAIKFAERMIAETEKKMNKMQDMGGASLNQVHWLLDAVTTVIDCRRLLQWSYVWAYLMEEDSTLKAHFKMHQDMLEEFTEELSAMTEQPLAKLVTDKARTSVINHTRVIQKFRQNIIDFAKANH